MIDVGDLGSINATLYYAIKDFEDNVLAENEENIIVINNLTLKRALNLPKETISGNYLFYSRVEYEELFATSSDTFKVNIHSRIVLFIVSVLLVVGIVIALMILYKKYLADVSNLVGKNINENKSSS